MIEEFETFSGADPANVARHHGTHVRAGVIVQELIVVEDWRIDRADPLRSLLAVIAPRAGEKRRARLQRPSFAP